jgi:2-keto-4-pentenoate hydratase/2-oxohepta-3-ene-1,7-dioic acid hydratase in catechol pathway
MAPSDDVENIFGVGVLAGAGGPQTAVVVHDHVLPLADIVARRSTPGAPAPAMREFLNDWDRWHDWLRNLDLKPSPDEGWKHIDSVKFGPCVPEPWNIFHTYHNYDRPSRISGKSDPPKAIRLLPDLFFGSRSALGAYGDTIMREHGGKQFDFELEVAIVIGREAYRVKAKDADGYIAGYTLANDFTMHFSWWTKLREGRRTNDSIRMKNFPGYTPLSRTVVPRDLVGDPHDLFVKAWIDGKPRQDTRTNAMLWSVQELVEYLSHVMTLRPGDLILSGAPEELPFAPGEPHGIAIGQTLDGRVEKIGRLVNIIGEQTERQPNEPESY